MDIKKFKTTIKCSGCVANVTPGLNEAVGADNWEVDLQDPGKILTITTDDKISDETVVAAVEKAGYKAEKIR